jgi:uncharacterized protein YrrD
MYDNLRRRRYKMRHFDFNLGAHLQCKDEACGKLIGLVIEPESRQVTSLIVDQGFLVTQAHVLPFAVVESALEDKVYLSLDLSEFDQYPKYRVIEHERPVTGLEQSPGEVATSYGLYGTSAPTVPTVKEKIHEGIPSGQLVIERETPVKTVEDKIGKVARVIVDRECQELTHLVIQRGLIFHEQLVLPISMIESIHENGILVSGTDEILQQLPHYEPEKLNL